MKKTKIQWADISEVILPELPTGRKISPESKFDYMRFITERRIKSGRKAESGETPAHQVTIKKQNINNN